LSKFISEVHFAGETHWYPTIPIRRIGIVSLVAFCRISPAELYFARDLRLSIDFLLEVLQIEGM